MEMVWHHADLPPEGYFFLIERDSLSSGDAHPAKETSAQVSLWERQKMKHLHPLHPSLP